MEGFNQLELVVAGSDAQQGTYFEARVDGIGLLDQVKAFEMSIDNDIAGAYMYGINREFLQRALSDQTVCLVPLVCNCGDIDCWQLQVSQTCVGDIITWHSWRNSMREAKQGWCYKRFPVFSFEKSAYAEVLRLALLQLQC